MGNNNGESEQLGDLLQGENYFGGRRHNKVDKSRLDRNMGVVRHRIDASLEKSIPFDGDKQVGGIPINVGQSLEVDPEPMVEIPNGQTCGASPPNDQL